MREAAARLLDLVDTTGGVRLLGVGVTGLADYTQEDLFAQAAGDRAAEIADDSETTAEPAAEQRPAPGERRWPAGHDVRHTEHGHGWVQGSGLGRVTVRFETPYSGTGRVRTFPVDDPDLTPADPLPLVPPVPMVAAVPCRPGGPGPASEIHGACLLYTDRPGPTPGRGPRWRRVQGLDGGRDRPGADARPGPGPRE